MRVDGFRFDLGTILARKPDGFKTESGFLKAIGQDPLLAEVKLIAEPWDCGPGGYQVGGFPPGWAEWNDPSAMSRAISGGARRARRRLRRAFAPHPTNSISAAESRGRASISSSPTTALRFATWSPTTTNTTRPTARATGTATRTIAHGTAEPKARPTTQNPGAALATDAQFSRKPLAFPGYADGVRRRRIRPHPERQQQRYCQDNEISWVNWKLDEEQLALVDFFRRLTALFHFYPVSADPVFSSAR